MGWLAFGATSPSPRCLAYTCCTHAYKHAHETRDTRKSFSYWVVYTLGVLTDSTRCACACLWLWLWLRQEQARTCICVIVIEGMPCVLQNDVISSRLAIPPSPSSGFTSSQIAAAGCDNDGRQDKTRQDKTRQDKTRQRHTHTQTSGVVELQEKQEETAEGVENTATRYMVSRDRLGWAGLGRAGRYLQATPPREIDGRLCVAAACQHTTCGVAQWKDVPGSD